MEPVEDKTGNAKQHMFYGVDPDRLYYSGFGDTKNTDKNLLPYKKDIQDQKYVEVNEVYIEALYTYMGAKVFVTGKYFIPVLYQIKLRKRDALGNPIGEEHSNPIICTRIYELELPDVIVDKYAVNIIIENII